MTILIKITDKDYDRIEKMRQYLEAPQHVDVVKYALATYELILQLHAKNGIVKIDGEELQIYPDYESNQNEGDKSL